MRARAEISGVRLDGVAGTRRDARGSGRGRDLGKLGDGMGRGLDGESATGVREAWAGVGIEKKPCGLAGNCAGDICKLACTYLYVYMYPTCKYIRAIVACIFVRNFCTFTYSYVFSYIRLCTYFGRYFYSYITRILVYSYMHVFWYVFLFVYLHVKCTNSQRIRTYVLLDMCRYDQSYVQIRIFIRTATIRYMFPAVSVPK